MTKWLRALPALLLLAACQHGPPCAFTLDPAFSDNERNAITNAGPMWAEAEPSAQVSFDVPWPGAPGDDHIIWRGTLGDLNGAAGEARWGSLPIGERQPGAITLIPDELEQTTKLTSTAAHEVGHHWGLRHSEHEGDLMYWKSGDEIGPRDVAAFCAAQGSCK